MNALKSFIEKAKKMRPLIIAGPCVVESLEQIISIAKAVKEAGAHYLRGGAYKPRTSPKSFQGLGEKGLEYLAQARKETGLNVVTEVMGSEEIDLVSSYADVLQIGSRNMYNYDLLKKIAQRAKTKSVLLKRGMQSTKEELLGAIDYLKEHGHIGELFICERGIRTFANREYTRFTLDIALIADLKRDTNFSYQIIADPSHSAGRSDLVEPLSYAAIAAGADGLIIETSIEPYLSLAMSDRSQHITPDILKRIVQNSQRLTETI